MDEPKRAWWPSPAWCRTAAEGLGQAAGLAPALEPVLTTRCPPRGQDPHAALGKLRVMIDPSSTSCGTSGRGDPHPAHGEVQLEILQALAAQRFGLAITFGPGIVYWETIAAPVEGVGRHEPRATASSPAGAPGSGLELAAAPRTCWTNWQRLVLTHLAEKPQGVLTGSPITDVRITLVAGRPTLSTEGATSAQATYRRCARASWRRRASCWSRGGDSPSCPGAGGPCRPPAHGQAGTPETAGALSAHGSARWRACGTMPGGGRSYPLGRLSRRRLRPCHNADEVIAALGYDPERDDNRRTRWCSAPTGGQRSGARSSPRPRGQRPAPGAEPPRRRPVRALQRVLRRLPGAGQAQAIFERTYGK